MFRNEKKLFIRSEREYLWMNMCSVLGDGRLYLSMFYYTVCYFIFLPLELKYILESHMCLYHSVLQEIRTYTPLRKRSEDKIQIKK